MAGTMVTSANENLTMTQQREKHYFDRQLKTVVSVRAGQMV